MALVMSGRFDLHREELSELTLIKSGCREHLVKFYIVQAVALLCSTIIQRMNVVDLVWVTAVTVFVNPFHVCLLLIG